jgi:hypothetical protein
MQVQRVMLSFASLDILLMCNDSPVMQLIRLLEFFPMAGRPAHTLDAPANRRANCPLAVGVLRCPDACEVTRPSTAEHSEAVRNSRGDGRRLEQNGSGLEEQRLS